MNPKPTWRLGKLRDVFDWLDLVRQRPMMYIGSESDLATLESLLWGYGTALSVHRIDELVPRFDRAFLAWIRIRYRWSTSTGWAAAVLRAVQSGQRPLDLFFELVDEYRKVSPRVIARARLGPANQATGDVGTDGLGRARPPPRELEIVQYFPERLFLLRYRYPSGVCEEAMFDNGKFETNVAFAKQFAWREFRVAKSQWKTAAGARSHRRGMASREAHPRRTAPTGVKRKVLG